MSSSKKKSKTSSTKTAPKTEPKGTLETSAWSKEDKDLLMSRMQSHIGKFESLKYTSAQDKMPWDKVAFDRFSADDCRQAWTILSREVRKYRTLTDLIRDAREYLRDPYKGQIKKHHDYPKRPLTPYFQFFMEKRPAFAAKHPDMSNLDVTVELSKRYRELPEAKKKKYVETWKKESELFQIALKKFKDDHPSYFNIPSSKVHEPRTPVLIFRDENLEEFSRRHPKMDKKECKDALKNQYKYLSDQEKQAYIEKALKEQEEYVTNLGKDSDNNPAVKKKQPKLILTKTERKLNDQYLGKPKKPPSNGYNLFCTETMPKLGNFSSQNRIVECARLWNLMAEEEKQALQARYIKMKKEYERNYSEFCKTLTPEQRQKEDELNKAKKGNPKQRSTGSGTGQVSIKVEHKEESSSDDDSSEDDDEMELNDSSDDSDSEESDEEDSDEEKEEEEEKKEQENDPETEKFQRLAPARPTTPISALFLYQKAHRRKVEAQYPGRSADEITRLLARRYHELPEHKRHKYLQKEKEQRAIYSEKMQNFIREENMKKNGVKDEKATPEQPQPVTGEQIYQEKLLPSYLKKADGDKATAERQLRNAWSKMNKGRREPFIFSAQERNEQNITAYREAVNAAAEHTVTMNDDKKKPRKRLKLAGEPKKPPTNGYQLFSASRIGSLSHLSQNEKFKEIGRLWTEFGPDKKKAYQDEAKKGSEKYKLKLAAWLKKLPKDLAAQYIDQVQNSKKRKKTTASTATGAKKAKIEVAPVQEEQEEEKASSESDEDTDSSSSEEESDDDDSEDDSSSSGDSSDSDDSDDDESSDDDDDTSSSDSE